LYSPEQPSVFNSNGRLRCEQSKQFVIRLTKWLLDALIPKRNHAE
jgi:hypothetical protein